MNLEKLTNNVLNETDEIIKKFGPRLAGTKASLDTADYLYEQGKNYSDQIYQDNFKINKGAFFGWINILVLFYVIGFIALILDFAIVSVILTVLSVLILYLQFIRYLPIIDFLFPSKPAKNVYGIIEPKGRVKRQIIISGHHDSAPIFNFFVNQPKLYNLRVTGSIFFVILSLILSLLVFFIDNQVLHITSITIVGIGLLLVLQMWFFKNKKATPGAGDNLTSTMIAFEIGKYFHSLKNTKDELKHTRVIFASFDAEEEGLRGARAFVKKHIGKLKETETTVLNIECLYDENALWYLTSDINNTVKLSDSLADELLAIGDKLNIQAHKQNIAILTGGTDAGEFGKLGIKATTIMGMPWTNDNRNTAYHTPNDIVENVSSKAVENTLNIFIHYIKENDN